MYNAAPINLIVAGRKWQALWMRDMNEERTFNQLWKYQPTNQILRNVELSL